MHTIHAFCTRVLQQFPFEADVAAHFSVLEDRTQKEMLERARMAVLLDAAAAPDKVLGRALRVATAAAADATQVANTTPSTGMPALERIWGLTTTMYAIVNETPLPPDG